MEVMNKVLDIVSNQVISPNLKDKVLDILSRYIKLESAIEELSKMSSTALEEEREEIKILLNEVRRVISENIRNNRPSASHIPFYIIQREKEKYSKELSEGNEYLEKLILTCCEYGIVTLSCCKGHKEENLNSFICLAITRNKREIINNIIRQLFDKEYSFIIQNVRNSITGLLITLPSKNNEIADNFFQSINEVIRNTDMQLNYYYLLSENIRKLISIFKKERLNNKSCRVGFKKSNNKFLYSIIAKDSAYRDLMWSSGFSYIKDDLGIIEVDKEEDATEILNRFYDAIAEYHRNNNPKLKQR